MNEKAFRELPVGTDVTVNDWGKPLQYRLQSLCDPHGFREALDIARPEFACKGCGFTSLTVAPCPNAHCSHAGQPIAPKYARIRHGDAVCLWAERESWKGALKQAEDTRQKAIAERTTALNEAFARAKIPAGVQVTDDAVQISFPASEALRIASVIR